MTKPAAAKEFRIEIAIPLPADPFAHSERMVQIKPMLAKITEMLAGFSDAWFDTSLVTPRPKAETAPKIVPAAPPKAA